MRCLQVATLFVLLLSLFAPAWAIVCPECGAVSDDSFNTCGWCGAELSSSATGRIAFESDRTGSWQIFVMDADELTIYDLSGRRIFTQLLDAVPGRHSLMLEMEDYPQGVYLARIAGEGASDTRRFVISR